jgi:hypothetical protein
MIQQEAYRRLETGKMSEGQGKEWRGAYDTEQYKEDRERCLETGTEG